MAEAKLAVKLCILSGSFALLGFSLWLLCRELWAWHVLSKQAKAIKEAREKAARKAKAKLEAGLKAWLPYSSSFECR